MVNSTKRSVPMLVVVGAVAMFVSTFAGCSKTKPKTGDKTESDKTTNEGKTSNGGSSGTKAALKPCTVVSQEELKAITGIDFSSTTPQGNPKFSSNCDYFTKDAKQNLGLAVIRKNGKSRITSEKAAPNSQSVDGVGDEAVWVPIPGSLTVRQGDDAVHIGLSKSIGDDATRIKYAKEIAKLVLSRI